MALPSKEHLDHRDDGGYDAYFLDALHAISSCSSADCDSWCWCGAQSIFGLSRDRGPRTLQSEQRMVAPTRSALKYAAFAETRLETIAIRGELGTQHDLHMSWEIPMRNFARKVSRGVAC